MNTWKHPILPHNGSSAFAAKGSLCRGGGTPRARPAAEVSTFCSCLSPFSPRERSKWQWVPLVLLPACPLQQRASLCPAGTSCEAAVGLNNVRRAGMGWHSLACAGEGEEMGNSLHIFSLCFQLAVEWGALGGTGGQGDRSCPLCLAVVLKPACAGAFPAGGEALTTSLLSCPGMRPHRREKEKLLMEMQGRLREGSLY